MNEFTVTLATADNAGSCQTDATPGDSLIDICLNGTRDSMATMQLYGVLLLDRTGCQHVEEAIHHFLQRADLNQDQPTVEIRGQHCTIRDSADGCETLKCPRGTLKPMGKSLSSDATTTAMQNLKHRPDEVRAGIARSTVELASIDISGNRFADKGQGYAAR